jgi:hypothetical protein
VNELLNAALKYHAMGFSIFPVNPLTKRPAIASWKKYQTNLATTEEIVQWFERDHHKGIAIATGDISNLFVVDLDKYKPGYDDSVVDRFFPDSLITPIAETMHKGQHLYFRNPKNKLTILANAFPGIDYRGNGGYVVAPPTTNEKGESYKWIVDIEQEIADLPGVFIDALTKDNNNSLYRCVYRGVTGNISGETAYIGGSSKINALAVSDADKTCDMPSQVGTTWDKNGGIVTNGTTLPPNATNVTNVTTCDIWENGVRDQNLFHVALCLAKTGNDNEYIFQTLAAIMKSWGEYDEKWIKSKIESAYERSTRKDRNIAAEIEEYVSLSDGYFSIEDVLRALMLPKEQDTGNIRKHLVRLKNKGIIEKHSQRNGVYKKVNIELEYITFEKDEKDEKPFPLELPFFLNDFVEISKGNIILVAGEFNAGKTTFMLNVLRMNKGKIPMRYISSEMSKSEFKKRFAGFNSVPPSFWLPDEMTDYIMKSEDFHTALRPDAINIIDYLEFPGGDFSLGSEIMRHIHDKIGDGIVVIAIQKKQGAVLPRSGDLVMEKPRLVISLSKAPGEDNRGIAEILKAKLVRLGRCDGKKLKFEITHGGSMFKTITDWGYWR